MSAASVAPPEAAPAPGRPSGAGAPGPDGGAWFEVGEDRVATKPPEARGLARDAVRLLVSTEGRVRHARFRDLPRFLRRGDVLVVNTSATLPAAVSALRTGGRPATVHLSTGLDDGSWGIEVRPPGRPTGPVVDAEPGERLVVSGGAAVTLLEPWPRADTERVRLWRARLVGAEVPDLLRRHGRPIAYAYVEGRWPLEAYQTVFARHPGSAEMPSAGRPFTRTLVTALVAAGVVFAPVVLHAGVSSLEKGEAPLPERFRVPRATAAVVNAARATGGRIVAVGTTAARALESAVDASGTLSSAGGWTDLVLGWGRPARVVDGLITGWHPAGASHLSLLEAVAGRERVREAYGEALAAGYLWHEFGDSGLFV